MMAVDKSKEYDADFLGFSEKLHRTNLVTWEKLGQGWRDSFREADVEIVVDAFSDNECIVKKLTVLLEDCLLRY